MFRIIKISFGLGWLLLFITAHAQPEPQLIINAHSPKTFRRNQLLRMPNLVHFTMSDTRAYPNTTLTFAAIKFCDLLKSFSIRENDTVELTSADQFIALVPARALLSCSSDRAIAYLAIEEKTHPWPMLSYNNPSQAKQKRGVTAGPYMVVWLHPEKSYISNEYWAWQLIKIDVRHHLDDKGYLMKPDTSSRQIQNGYDVYVSHCLACHTVNKKGKATIGPDLNHTQLQHFENDSILKRFIRDPQSVRRKKDDRMSGTDETSLSNKDLRDLISYLRYMTAH